MKNLVVAGNGPSLANIDYSRLPDDFHVFRCNQFYFEDKYYLGKEIKAVFFNPIVFFNQYFTAMQLKMRGEYEIDKILCNQMYWLAERVNTHLFAIEKHDYPDVDTMYNLLSKFNMDLLAQIKYHDTYFQERPTTGALMVAVGAALGYREIYLTGIDFYEGDHYAFDWNKRNINEFMNYQGKPKPATFHTKRTDINLMKFIMKKCGVRVQSLSPSSSLEQIFPFTLSGRQSNFQILNKPDGYIDDILIATKYNPNLHIQRENSKQALLTQEEIAYRIKKIERHINSNTFRIWFEDIKKITTKLSQQIRQRVVKTLIRKTKSRLKNLTDKFNLIRGGTSNNGNNNQSAHFYKLYKWGKEVKDDTQSKERSD